MNLAIKICKLSLLVVSLFSIFFSVKANIDPGLKYVQNKNQWPGQVLFYSDVTGGSIFLLKDKFRLCFYNSPDNDFEKGHHDRNRSSVRRNDDGSQVDTKNIFFHTIDVNFVNSNESVFVSGNHELKTRYNYFIGNDPSKWTSNAKSFSDILYHNVYDSIDLSVYSQGFSMKYEWIVKPQAATSQIQLEYAGAEQLDLVNGNLHIKTSINEIWEYKPYAYQIKNGRKVTVPCEFTLKKNILSYTFPESYDECYELIIDPILIFSGYSGSTIDNWGNSATYDSHGNTYSGGMVNNPLHATGYPTTTGAYQTVSPGGDWDIGILKYDSSGANVLYATYVGGSGVESPQSLVVSNKDELLIMGATSSNDFPVTNGTTFKGGESVDPIWGVYYGGGTDIYIAKLTASGDALIGGTYLGGTANDGINYISGIIYESGKEESPLAKNYGDQQRGDIIVDANDTIYVASNTRSNDFTGRVNAYGGGSHDAIVVKLLPDLSAIQWAKYLGGSKTDASYSIKLTSNHVYVGGGTQSADFPGMNGLITTYRGNIDGWVASLSKSTAATVNATYLGTAQYDQTYFIDLNEAGEVYAYGQTKGQYPVMGNVYSNEFAGQFIHKLSPDLKATIFSTTVGSKGSADTINPNISPTAFSVNDCSTIFIAGWGGDDNVPAFTLNNGVTYTFGYVGGNTFNMPISSDAYQKTTSGSDFYLAVFSADASHFLYGTYLGGNKSATHVDGGTSRFDKKGIVYHAVCAGCGGFSDFPAVNVPPAHQKNKSENCNNAAFKFDLSVVKAKLQTNSVKFDQPGLNRICLPDGIAFQNKCIGGKTYEWDFGDGTTTTKTDTSSIIHQYQNEGTYLVKLKAIDDRTCKGFDSTSTVVHVYTKKTTIQDDDTECFGSPYTLKAHGKAFYDWSTKDGSFQAHDTLTTHVVNPQDTTMYYVTITEDGGCIRKDSVQINVIPGVDVDFKISKLFDCFSRPKIEVVNTTPKLKSTDQFAFSFGDTETSDADHAVHDYDHDNIYHVKLTVMREFCVYEKTADAAIYTLKSPNVITPGTKEGKNDFFFVQYGDIPDKSPADYGLNVSLLIYNRWGKIIYQSHDYKGDWSGEGLPTGVYYYELSVAGETICKDWVHLIR